MTPPDYLELLKLAAPELIVVIAALAVLAGDILWMRGRPAQSRMFAGATVSGAGCLAAILWLMNTQQMAGAAGGMLVIDPATRLLKIGVLVCALFTLLISSEGAFTRNAGEYFALMLLATVGMLFLVSSEELLMIFLSLELTSLSLYVLTAFNKENAGSAEAALKYFLFGGMAAAFTLFGLSLLYGLSEATTLRGIAAGLSGTDNQPLFYLAMIMTLIGFGFKVAAVPFHLWAPDAYQGAPTPSAALIASGSKVASFFILAKVVMIGFAGAEGSGTWRAYAPGWVPVLAVFSLLSMALGNLAAIAQTSVKRLLAYSAIAHGGYSLLGIAAHDQRGTAALLYYVLTYALTVIGAFGVVHIICEKAGSDRFAAFAGLSRRSALLSFCLLIFMLSLAGIPPLAGFFGKFYLFAAILGAEGKNLGWLWLVVVALAMSAVSLYYYLQLLKQVYVMESPAGAPPIRASPLGKAAVFVLALSVIVLGCLPHLLVDPLNQALKNSPW